MSTTDESAGIYAPPTAAATGDQEPGILISAGAASDFRASVTWMERTGTLIAGLLLLKFAGDTAIGWQWLEYSTNMTVAKVVVSAISLTSLLWVLAKLRCSTRDAIRNGPEDAALVASLRQQRHLWKRTVLLVFIWAAAALILFLVGLKLLQ